MTIGSMFNRVKALADDGITVRILNVGDELRASIDFPTFQHPDGKFYKANLPIPMKPPLCSEMIAPVDSGMISPPV